MPNEPGPSDPEIILVTSFHADPTTRGQNHLLRLISGGKQYLFLLDSPLAKMIAKQLSKQVKAFEAELGEVFDDRLDNESLLTPLEEFGGKEEK